MDLSPKVYRGARHEGNFSMPCFTDSSSCRTIRRVQQIIIDKPYIPVPPHRGRIWPALIGLYVPHFLRKSYGVEKIDFLHADRLKSSLAAGHGILLAPNHSRDEDPLVLGMLGRAVGSPIFIMASWHLFMRTKLKTFLLRRGGAFSVYREGIDRVAVNTAVEILETAERPLVVFPEGFISRTNEHLNEMMDGTALIARSAAKKRAKMDPPKKVVVHPIALRYEFHSTAATAVAAVLDEIEKRLTWAPLKHLPLIDRIYKVGAALLTLKELEYLGHEQPGDIGTRLKNLIDAILNPLEDEWCKGQHDGNVNARAKRLRFEILPDMINGELGESERERRWKHLADVYLAMQLHHYPPDYVKSNPTPGRIIETVERFEEDVTDKIRRHGPITAKVTVGEAIEVNPQRESRGADDPLMTQIRSQIQSMLGIDP